MRYHLVIAFAMGMLSGVMLWPSGSDSAGSGRQSTGPTAVASTKVGRVKAGLQPGRYADGVGPAMRNQGGKRQYGMASSRSQNKTSAWEPVERYGDRPYSAIHTHRSGAFASIHDGGVTQGYTAPIQRSTYLGDQRSDGYRFRPLETRSPSDRVRRYTGSYQMPYHPPGGRAIPHWQELPDYSRPQPRRHRAPDFPKREFYLNLPPGDLYTAR